MLPKAIYLNTLLGLILLTPNSDENEISLYVITTCSNIQVMRIKKVITKDKMSWSLDKFHKKCMENCKENMHFYIRA